MKWIGSIAPSHYPALMMSLSYGDEVEVPDDVLKRDPDRWEDPKPVKGKPGKAPDDNAEVEG